MSDTSHSPSLEQVKILGTTIPYQVRGQGAKQVVFIYGANHNLGCWRKVIPQLDQQQFTCWAVSLPVYSDQYQVSEYAQLIKEFMRIKQITNPYLVGHSLGGLISIKLLQTEEVPVQKAVIIATPLIEKVPRLTRWSLNYLLKIISKYRRAEAVANLVWQTIAVYPFGLEKVSLISYLQCYTDILNEKLPFDPRQISFNIPVTLVMGRFDKLVDWLFNGNSLYDKIGAERIIKINTGHFIPETRPRQLSMIISEFFGV